MGRFEPESVFVSAFKRVTHRGRSWVGARFGLFAIGLAGVATTSCDSTRRGPPGVRVGAELSVMWPQLDGATISPVVFRVGAVDGWCVLAEMRNGHGWKPWPLGGASQTAPTWVNLSNALAWQEVTR